MWQNQNDFFLDIWATAWPHGKNVLTFLQNICLEIKRTVEIESVKEWATSPMTLAGYCCITLQPNALARTVTRCCVSLLADLLRNRWSFIVESWYKVQSLGLHRLFEGESLEKWNSWILVVSFFLQSHAEATIAETVPHQKGCDDMSAMTHVYVIWWCNIERNEQWHALKRITPPFPKMIVTLFVGYDWLYEVKVQQWWILTISFGRACL